MFLLELKFNDDSRRIEARPAHRARLQQLYAEGRLVMAGPWADDSGAALVFDTDRAGVEQILADDPYYATPGVEVVSVRAWNPFLGSGGR
ncbi:YciI family protein [Actinopolymorpha sp. B11F2]|uniref:YciI family protein n=1 Tax=Actinopolymorpha sp. B11F2 TaxID=3160862 RepID=UPI0032E522A7